jgi:predicted outer membrane protein
VVDCLTTQIEYLVNEENCVMKFLNVIRAGVATAFIGATVLAQQPNPAQPGQTQPGQTQPGQTQPGTGQNKPARGQSKQSGMHLTNDAIAACLAIENQEEIQIAQFAKDKTNNEEVKKFASMLVEEHTAMLEALRQAAPNSTQVSTLKESTQRDGTQRDGTQRDGTQRDGTQRDGTQRDGTQRDGALRDGTPRTGAEGPTLEIVQLQRELAEQCLSDSKELLTQKSEGDFDKCFVGMQFAKHAGMQSKLTVLQRHVTGELKDVVSQGLETTKKHMKHAEELMSRMDSDSTKEATSERRKTERE